MSTMFVRRSALALTRRAAIRSTSIRPFSSSIARYEAKPVSDGNPKPGQSSSLMTKFEDIKDEHDLVPPGGKPGTVPSDLEQATGLERLEILGKMQGVDVFDMRPLPSDRKGTLQDPITVKSYGDEQYLGCTGLNDQHTVIWLTCSRDRPIERCPECGSVYKMEYVGPPESHDTHGHSSHDPHGDSDGAHNYGGEPKTMADYVDASYR